MKVISYLELSRSFERHIYRPLENFIAYKNQFPTAVEFYALPITPELIEELFEGWVEDFERNIKYDLDEEYTKIISVSSRGIETIRVSEYGINYNSETVIWINSEGFYWQKLPRTLDEFITDCQRAGIELEWRIDE